MGACAEPLPIIKRLELELEDGKYKWVPIYWPPSMGSTRDLPL